MKQRPGRTPETAETRTLRRAGIPLSRAVFTAQRHRRKPAFVVWATAIFAVGYVGLAGGWALWSLEGSPPVAQAGTAPMPGTPPADPVAAAAPAPAPQSADLAAQTAQRIANAQAAASAAQAKLQSTEARLARVEQQLASAAQPIPAPAATEDCVTALARLAHGARVTFPLGAVQPANPTDLAGVAQFARAATSCPAARVIVEGHTDSTGDETLNLQISWDRADNTIAWLQAQGIDTGQFSAMGFGARLPLSEGDSDSADSDRRVEFRVIRHDPATD